MKNYMASCRRNVRGSSKKKKKLSENQRRATIISNFPIYNKEWRVTTASWTTRWVRQCSARSGNKMKINGDEKSFEKLKFSGTILILVLWDFFSHNDRKKKKSLEWVCKLGRRHECWKVWNGKLWQFWGVSKCLSCKSCHYQNYNLSESVLLTNKQTK